MGTVLNYLSEGTVPSPLSPFFVVPVYLYSFKFYVDRYGISVFFLLTPR